eukprot:4285699-Pleurochrysis_carterae.AAC.5
MQKENFNLKSKILLPNRSAGQYAARRTNRAPNCAMACATANLKCPSMPCKGILHAQRTGCTPTRDRAKSTQLPRLQPSI